MREALRVLYQTESTGVGKCGVIGKRCVCSVEQKALRLASKERAVCALSYGKHWEDSLAKRAPALCEWFVYMRACVCACPRVNMLEFNVKAKHSRKQLHSAPPTHKHPGQAALPSAGQWCPKAARLLSIKSL
eukprot:1161601-Pelagomonas_calceolata.AAC.18